MAQGNSQKSSPANINAVDVTSNSSSESVSLVNGMVRLQYFESILQDSIKATVIYYDLGNSINGQSVIEGLPLNLELKMYLLHLLVIMMLNLKLI